MKTIIVGYTDREGLSAPEIICGPEVPPGDQAEGMSAAKRLHKFPSGIQRVEMYALGEAVETAIFISDATATAVQNNDKRNRQLEREQRERNAVQSRAEANLIQANKVFTIFSQKRNNAIAAVAAQKNKLSAALSDKDRNAVVNKIAELQPLADRAILEFKTVLAARDVIKDKDSAPEDVAAAIEILKDPVKWTQKTLADAAAAEKALQEKTANEKAAAEKLAAEQLAAANTGGTLTPPPAGSAPV